MQSYSHRLPSMVNVDMGPCHGLTPHPLCPPALLRVNHLEGAVRKLVQHHGRDLDHLSRLVVDLCKALVCGCHSAGVTRV